MKKKHVLPIETPEFICYNYLTWSNAIVRANAKDKANILMCSKYINCCYKEASTKHKFIIGMFDHWCTAQKFMQHQIISLLKEAYKKGKKDLTFIIKKCLLNDAYVFGICNHAYIEDNIEGDTTLFNFVIIGFDDIAHEFIIYGLDNSERFSCYHVNYERFIEALFDTPDLKITLNMWRYNKDVTITLDIPNIIFELEDYLNSTNRRNHYTADKIYGVNAMKELSRHFYETAQNDLTLNEFYLHKFSIHKTYMRKRMECLVANGVLDRKWCIQADQVAKMGSEVFELGRVFNNSHDKILIDKLVEIMANIIGLEISYLPKVLENLKAYNQKLTV